jgi:hypothetical protein
MLPYIKKFLIQLYIEKREKHSKATEFIAISSAGHPHTITSNIVVVGQIQ